MVNTNKNKIIISIIILILIGLVIGFFIPFIGWDGDVISLNENNQYDATKEIKLFK